MAHRVYSLSSSVNENGLTTLKDARPVQMYTFPQLFLQGRVVLRSARLDDLGAAVVPARPGVPESAAARAKMSGAADLVTATDAQRCDFRIPDHQAGGVVAAPVRAASGRRVFVKRTNPCRQGAMPAGDGDLAHLTRKRDLDALACRQFTGWGLGWPRASMNASATLATPVLHCNVHGFRHRAPSFM